MRIYLDADDTLLKFREHAIECGVPAWSGTWYTTPRDQWTDEQKFIQDRTNELMRTPDFWLTMPHWEGAHELIAASSFHGPVCVLTATPSSLAGEPDVIEMVRRAKVQRMWQALHVPPERVIVVPRAHKMRYAFDPFEQRSCLLIDDAEQNCREWTEAGGEAYHFGSPDDPDAMWNALNFVKCL